MPALNAADMTHHQQARGWETRNRSFKTQTTLGRSSGLSSFTQLTPTAEQGLRLGMAFSSSTSAGRAIWQSFSSYSSLRRLASVAFIPRPVASSRSGPITEGHNRIGKALTLVRQLLSVGCLRMLVLVSVACHSWGFCWLPGFWWSSLIGIHFLHVNGSSNDWLQQRWRRPAAKQSRKIKQNTCASGGSRDLAHRWPGFTQEWPI